MAAKPERIVLDSWSIIAYLEKEPAGVQVAEIIAQANEGGQQLMTTVVNAGEVWYITARRTSPLEATVCIGELQELGIEFSDVGWGLAQQAATFKAKHKMSFADCFAAALAMTQKAQLVTGDREFRQVEREIAIRWL